MAGVRSDPGTTRFVPSRKARETFVPVAQSKVVQDEEGEGGYIITGLVGPCDRYNNGKDTERDFISHQSLSTLILDGRPLIHSQLNLVIAPTSTRRPGPRRAYLRCHRRAARYLQRDFCGEPAFAPSQVIRTGSRRVCFLYYVKPYSNSNSFYSANRLFRAPIFGRK
jgi:hypothetical protein